MQRAYAHAIASGYRFYSYGDACLLLRGRAMTEPFLLHACSTTDGAARRGEIVTAARRVQTPAFMPVGTPATVKGDATATTCARPAPRSCSATPII